MKWIYVVAVLVIVVLAGVSAVSGDISLKDLILATLPIFGTFLGATLAFRLNENREVVLERSRQKQALNYALFVLLQQLNAISLLHRDYCKDKNDAQRGFVIPALKPPDHSELRHDFSGLSFLLEVADPQLMLDLTIEDQRFHQIVEALRIRNEFYVGEVQPAMHKAGLLDQIVSLQQVKDALDGRIYKTAMDQGSGVKGHLEASMESIPEMITALRAAAKKLFPGAKFISYEV